MAEEEQDTIKDAATPPADGPHQELTTQHRRRRKESMTKSEKQTRNETTLQEMTKCTGDDKGKIGMETGITNKKINSPPGTAMTTSNAQIIRKANSEGRSLTKAELETISKKNTQGMVLEKCMTPSPAAAAIQASITNDHRDSRSGFPRLRSSRTFVVYFKFSVKQ